jgi:hypothetical protein
VFFQNWLFWIANGGSSGFNFFSHHQGGQMIFFKIATRPSKTALYCWLFLFKFNRYIAFSD